MRYNALFNSFWEIAGAVNLRLKVLGIILGLILLLGTVVTVQMRNVMTEVLRAELTHQGAAIARTTAEQTAEFLPSDIDSIRFLLQEKLRHYSTDEHNTLVAYITLNDAEGAQIAQVSNQNIFSTDTIHEIVAPLPDDAGIVYLGLAENNIREIVSDVTVQIIEITVLIAGMGFAAALFLTWILTQPILTLVDATQAVAQRDFTRRVPRWANDEIGDLAVAFNAMTEALEQAEHERAERETLRANYLQGVIRAQEEERKRIARELHDSTSQSLTSLLVGLRNLEEATTPETSHQRIAEIRQVVNHTLEEVHKLAWQLRPSVLDDLGLIAALERYIADYQTRFGIEVDFVTRGVCERLPLSVETTVYRIVQEALTNTARHAKAKHASVLIEQRAQLLRLILEDDGSGFDPNTRRYGEQSLGLQGIHERVNLFNGKLTIESAPGQGTSLFVEIPVQEQHNEEG